MGSTWANRVARKQRRNMTGAELRLWDLLKNRQLGGYQFQRQRLLGNQIVDFYCPSQRLIIEISRPAMFAIPTMKDAISAMDEALRQRGFGLLRLSEDDVMRRPDAAILRIFQVLRPFRLNTTSAQKMDR